MNTQNKPLVLKLPAKLNLRSATDSLTEGRKLAGQGDLQVDFSSVTEADSMALALLLEWQQVATASGHRLSVVALPESLLSLARLYGVLELLPLDEQPAST